MDSSTSAKYIPTGFTTASGKNINAPRSIFSQQERKMSEAAAKKSSIEIPAPDLEPLSSCIRPLPEPEPACVNNIQMHLQANNLEKGQEATYPLTPQKKPPLKNMENIMSDVVEESEEEEEEPELSPICFVFPKDLPHLRKNKDESLIYSSPVCKRIDFSTMANKEEEEEEESNEREETKESVEMNSNLDDVILDDDDIFPTPFSSIQPNSKEIVDLLYVYVARLYPLSYMTKDACGTTVYDSEVSYLKNEQKREYDKERLMEDLLGRMEKEIEEEMMRVDRKNLVGRSKTRLVKEELELMDSRDLYYLMKLQGEEDVIYMHNMLSKEKIEELENFRNYEMNRIRSKVELKYQDEKRKITEVHVPVLKLRIVDISSGKECKDSALLCLWRPNESLLKDMKEGKSYELRNVSVGYTSLSLLKFNSTRTSQISFHTDQKDLHKYQRKVTRFSEIYDIFFNPQFYEFDTVGIIVYISGAKNDSSEQIIYIADESSKILSIKIWKLIGDLGLTNVLVVGNFIAIQNIHWRSISTKQTPLMAYFQDVSVFSTSPSQEYLKYALDNLKKTVKNVPRFVKHCESSIPQISVFASK